MKNFLLFLLLSVFSYANSIDITIEYGKNRSDKKVYTIYSSGEVSALDLLKRVADVEVSKGKYKFANSIDGVKSKVKTYGWFYTVDGKATKKMASDYILIDEKSMTWTYKISACY